MGDSMKRTLTALAVLAGLIAIPATPAHAATICEKYGSTSIQGGRYIVQNNNWGDDTTQCINTTDTGFSITTASHNKPTNGAPGSYPSVFFGCHYGNCSANSGLPLQASAPSFSSYRTSASFTYSSSGVYNASYDIWFDPTPRTNGQNTGAELMIWLNRQGSIQPIGSRTGTANINGATWEVWFGNIGWNVISYLRTSATTSADFTVESFYGDAVNRGHAQRNWYMTSIQAGFEPWVGQTGLAVNTFSVSTSGGGDTQPPTTPQNLTAGSVTSSSAALSWSASSDNIGVSGYAVSRNGTQIATVSATSYTATGLSPSTAYQFQVAALDAAGNRSAPATVSVTTAPGGGGGSCSATITAQSEWQQGYVAAVNVQNTSSSTITGWTVTFTLPAGHTIVNSWNAQLTVSGQNVTARNVSHNGTLGPNAVTSWGFQANRNGGGLPATASCS